MQNDVQFQVKTAMKFCDGMRFGLLDAEYIVEYIMVHLEHDTPKEILTKFKDVLESLQENK